jgi:hypothetical protein
MSLDIEFLQAYVAFLKNAFPANLDAKVAIERTDIMVYALTATLCSMVGTKLDFLDFVSQGRPGGGGPHYEPRDDQGRPGGPHTDQGPPGGGGPHRLQKLVSYATDVSTPALANAFRNSQRAG